ncbi:MAG: hypothetical protein ACKN9A_13710 [Microcystis aeruginosa]
MRSRVASAFGNAAYLGCAETVPLSQRMAEVERKIMELESLAKGKRDNI